MPNAIPTSRRFFAPIFIVADRSVVANLEAVDVAMLRAVDDLQGRGANLLTDARSTAESVIVDPCAEHLAFGTNRGRCESVPYWTILDPSSLADRTDRDQFVRSVLDYQISLGADVLVAPGFIVSGLTSPWLKVNGRLLVAATQLMATSPYSDYQWAVSLTLGPDVYSSSAGRVAIRSSMLPFEPDFVLLKALDSGDAAETALLTGHAAIVSDLSQFVAPVIASTVGSFGLGLCAVGACGFASGLQWINRPTETYFRGTQTGYGGTTRPRGFVYLPEILQSIDEAAAEAVRDVQYTDIEGNETGAVFGPPYQMGSWPPTGDVEKNTHFARSRLSEASALSDSADVPQTVSDMYSDAQNAAEAARAAQPAATQIDTTMILRWLNAMP